MRKPLLFINKEKTMKHISLSKKTLILLAAAAILLFTSCQSVPTDVPEDLTRRDLIQLAQDSYEAGNIAASEYYYDVIIGRFGDDPSSRVMAQFEIAHLQIKEKNYRKAQPLLEEIIATFDKNPDLLYVIPEYLKLAMIDLEKCR